MAALAPALVTIGRADWAEQLADGIADPAQRERVLVSLATALAASGYPDQADRIVCAIVDSATRADALARLGAIFITTADMSRAERAALDSEQAARGTRPAALEPSLLHSLSATLAMAGELRCAEQIARGIVDPESRAQALGQLAVAFAGRGEHDSAQRAALDAEQATSEIVHPASRAQALVQLAATVAAGGAQEAAERIALGAERAIKDIVHPLTRATGLARLAATMAASGQLAQARKQVGDAERAATDTVDPVIRAQVLAAKAAAMAAIEELDLADEDEPAQQDVKPPQRRAPSRDDPERAAAILLPLDKLLREGGTPPNPVLAQGAATLAALGQFEVAEQLARAIGNDALKAWSLGQIATVSSTAGRGDAAGPLVEEALQVAEQISDLLLRDEVMASLAIAFADFSEGDQADSSTSDAEPSILDRSLRTEDLVHAALELARSGPPEREERAADKLEPQEAGPKTPLNHTAIARLAASSARSAQFHLAERVVVTITDPVLRARTKAILAASFGRSGRFRLAERVVAGITDPVLRAQAMARLATALSESGHRDLAKEVTTRIEDAGPAAEALVELALTNIAIGDFSRAEQLALEGQRAASFIDSPWQRTRILTDIACVYLKTGQHSQARRAAEQASQAVAGVSDLCHQAKALGRLAIELAKVGLRDEAGRAAAGIADPVFRVSVLAQLYSTDSAYDQPALMESFVQTAETVAREAADHRLKARALAQLAAALASVGQRAGAEQAARDAERVLDEAEGPPWQTVQLLTELGDALGSPDRLNRAEKAAGGVSDLSQRGKLLAQIVVAFAAHGQPERAAQVAEEVAKAVADIGVKAQRAVTLSEIDERLRCSDLEQYLPVQFRHLCGDVLVSQFWRVALPMVCRIDPHAFVTVIDVLVPTDSGSRSWPSVALCKFLYAWRLPRDNRGCRKPRHLWRSRPMTSSGCAPGFSPGHSCRACAAGQDRARRTGPLRAGCAPWKTSPGPSGRSGSTRWGSWSGRWSRRRQTSE